MGVWIETPAGSSDEQTAESHPSWVCGLKHLFLVTMYLFCQSHPSWVCGLKPEERTQDVRYQLSHPSWVCGLKLTEQAEVKAWGEVTPFVGVWIETARSGSG